MEVFMYNSTFNLERLTKTKEDIDNLIRNYQLPINTQKDDVFVFKKLNEQDEAENILINSDTIFIGSNRMQIKKLDGTIEKYNIEKYYPIDEKDVMIRELNKKVEELERKLNDESTKYVITNKQINESITNDDGNVESKSKTTNKSIPK